MIRHPETGTPVPLPCRKAPYRSVNPQGWRYLGVGPGDMPYLSNSSPCNICEREVGFGEIRRVGLDSSDAQPILAGMRNIVGFDWNPKTGNLWSTDPEMGRRCDEFTDPVALLGAHTPLLGMPFHHGTCSATTTRGRSLSPSMVHGTAPSRKAPRSRSPIWTATPALPGPSLS